MTNEVKLLPCERGYELANWLSGWLQDKADDFRPDTITQFRAIVEHLHATRPTIVTDEVVERVARVLAVCASRHGTLCEGEQPEDSWEAWEEEARAVLAAMPAIVGGE